MIVKNVKKGTIQGKKKKSVKTDQLNEFEHDGGAKRKISKVKFLKSSLTELDLEKATKKKLNKVRNKNKILKTTKNNSKKRTEESTVDKNLDNLKELSTEKNEKKLTKEKKEIKALKKPKNSIKIPREIENQGTDNENIENSDSEQEINEKKIKKKNKNDKKSKAIENPDELEIHKKDLENLKNIDPEFYEFLKENDKKLLEFDLEDSDFDDNDDADELNNTNNDDIIHKPNPNLEVASDESDFEQNDEEFIGNQITNLTLKTLKIWESELQSDNITIETLRNIIQAFSSALATISGIENKNSVYKVTESGVFNKIIQLCVLYLQNAIYKYLNYSIKSKQIIHKTKKWKKIQSSLRIYFLDLTRLLEQISSENILIVLLKHLHQMCNMISSFNSITKPILKRLIILWSTSNETIRVLSFLCILKISRTQQIQYLNHILKAMYFSYIRNSKFVSPNTLPGINFMRRSLVEMFALDLNIAYQHSFLYIRQLAIHLRNAIILKKKDSFQSVYNWQFINSLKLWIELICSTIDKIQLEPLIYPLVSIITGVIKLIPTAQYFPLRFHCIQCLIKLSKHTKTFIPILPFILEVLKSNTFNKKHTKVSMKPISFICILRLNKPQMTENGFRNEVIENIFALTLEYLSNESNSLAYPDLIVPTVYSLKEYLKNCKNANYSRKLKQLLDKILENSKFIENERKKINFSLKDKTLIQSWETNIYNKGTPLNNYYNNWIKTYETKKKRQAANTDNINDYNLPVIKRKRITEIKNNEDNGPVELFPSDSEDDNINNDENEKLKNKKLKKIKKKKQNINLVKDEEEQCLDNEENVIDIVEDLDINDW